jgi:IS5 family transposase
MNTKLHAVTDENGRPIRFFMTAGEVSDYTGAAALLSNLPSAQWLLADRGYDAKQGDQALHPWPEVPNKTRQIRQAQIQTPQQDRDHVRPSEGLAAGRNALRQMPEGLPLSRSPRRNRLVLALTINESGA